MYYIINKKANNEAKKANSKPKQHTHRLLALGPCARNVYIYN